MSVLALFTPTIFRSDIAGYENDSYNSNRDATAGQSRPVDGNPHQH
jgi:hypothetical protein